MNLLIATTADITEHPDLAKFAQECIDLVHQIKRNGEYEDDEILAGLEAYARETKDQIEEMLKAQAEDEGDDEEEEEGKDVEVRNSELHSTDGIQKGDRASEASDGTEQAP